LLALAATAAGCASAGDLFHKDHPAAADLRATLAVPRPASSDAALVLGCPPELDGTPSLCERCRVKAAVRQYERGRVRALLFSGGAAHSVAVEADVMAEMAQRHGVPPEHVLRERRALTTWQNLRYAAELLRARHWSTVLVISTSDHLPRARRIAQYYGLDDGHASYLACDVELAADTQEERSSY
jgi:uncharacterized SAM-binding protein YcdF (DUF218 family)